MASTDTCMTEFLQDNLLSDDDWGTLNVVDLSDLTSTSSKSLINDDFLIGEGENAFQEYASYSDESEDKHLDPAQQDLFSSLSPTSTGDQDIVDELLEDIMYTRNVSKQNLLNDQMFDQQPVEGHSLVRRCSTHTSSSSAYSSCSSDASTPPPQSVDHLSDLVSCSPGEHSPEFCTQDTYSPETFEFDLQAMNTPIFQTKNETNCQNKTNSCTKPTKSNRYKAPQSTRRKSKDEETDLERAVRLACEETNRLLRMHKKTGNTLNKTDETANESKRDAGLPQQKKDLLKDLCESTILNNHAENTKEKVVKEQAANKALKRKANNGQSALERIQALIKRPALSPGNQHVNVTAPPSRTSLVNHNVKTRSLLQDVQTGNLGQENEKKCIIISQPQTPLQTRVTLDGVSITPTQTLTITQAPEPITAPLQLLVKHEASPSFPIVNGIIQSPQSSILNNQKVYVSTGSNLSLNVPNSGISIVKQEPLICQGGQTIVIQQAPTVNTQQTTQQVNISDLKPGSDPVVLSQSELSRLAAQGVIKFQPKKPERCLKPSSDYPKQLLTEHKPPTQTPTVPKKHTLVPAASDLLQTNAAAVINGTSVVVNGADNQMKMGELDMKALKRHQRMIKNRASACQSRQRRKEYLKTLEDQVTEVAAENTLLREQNEYLNARLKELEIENDSLRNIIGIQASNRKKAACVLMLMLFVGINFYPVGLFGGSSTPPFQSPNPAAHGYNGGLDTPITPNNGFRSGRHLLSTDDDAIYMEKNEQNESLNTERKDLMVSNKQSFWMDDLVREYKHKHLENFLQLLSETTSNSAKRLLRRKLKEEFGINIPLPVPRHRRIAYTPRGSRKVHPPKIVKAGEDELSSSLNSGSATGAVKDPPTSLPQPCDSSFEEPELNETETIRLNNVLVEWAQRYTVDRQVKAQQKAQKKNVPQKKYTSTKAPSSRYELNDNATVSNEIAVYSRPNKKYDDFLDAINRRNDTFYVVSLNRDHLLLPATFQNSSSRMKMALVMPAVTSKDHSSHDEYETMIQIECEVTSTRMFDLKRKDVPEFLIVPSKTPTLDTVSNDTVSNAKDVSMQIPDKTTSANSGKLKVKRKQNSRSSSEKINRKNLVKSKRAKFEQQIDQEEDAVVSDVADTGSYKQDFET